MRQQDRDFIVNGIYKNTEGGYSHVPGDPETYLSNTKPEWVHALTHLSDEQKARFPQRYQAAIREIENTHDDNRRSRLVSQLMQDAGRGLRPFGGGGQPARGEPRRSVYEPLPNLSAEQAQLMNAMEDVSAHHTYQKYIKEPGFDHYPECVRYKMVISGVNGGPIRAKAQLVNAMYESKLLSSEEWRQYRIAPEALASRAPFAADGNPDRERLYRSGALDKLLLDRLKDLPGDSQTLLSRRFAVMRNDFHLDLIDNNGSKARFADGWHNSTFQKVWTPPAEYDHYHNPAKWTEYRTPEVHYDTSVFGKDEVTIHLSKDSVLKYSVDPKTHQFTGIKNLPKGMQLVMPGDKFDEHQHPGPERIANPYPNEPVAVYVSADTQHSYFLPLSRIAQQVETRSREPEQKVGFWRGLGNFIFGGSSIPHKPMTLSLAPDNGHWGVMNHRDPNQSSVFQLLPPPVAPSPAPAHAAAPSVAQVQAHVQAAMKMGLGIFGIPYATQAAAARHDTLPHAANLAPEQPGIFRRAWNWLTGHSDAPAHAQAAHAQPYAAPKLKIIYEVEPAPKPAPAPAPAPMPRQDYAPLDKVIREHIKHTTPVHHEDHTVAPKPHVPAPAHHGTPAPAKHDKPAAAHRDKPVLAHHDVPHHADHRPLPTPAKRPPAAHAQPTHHDAPHKTPPHHDAPHRDAHPKPAAKPKAAPKPAKPHAEARHDPHGHDNHHPAHPAVTPAHAKPKPAQQHKGH